jgi:hypothetical protein
VLAEKLQPFFAIDTSFFLSCLWRPLWLLVNANVW